MTRSKTEREAALERVCSLAESCDYEEGHSQQVTRLALRLFDELRPLHDLADKERFWLECAGLLHDIGFSQGTKQHHKSALRIILESRLLPFDERERHIIGSVARYHRRALPQEKHDHFARLGAPDRKTVSILAALLRVADGLDRTHTDAAKDLSCEVRSDAIVLHCVVDHPAEPEEVYAMKKSELLQEVFNRQLVITWQLP